MRKLASFPSLLNLLSSLPPISPSALAGSWPLVIHKSSVKPGAFRSYHFKLSEIILSSRTFLTQAFLSPLLRGLQMETSPGGPSSPNAVPIPPGVLAVLEGSHTTHRELHGGKGDPEEGLVAIGGERGPSSSRTGSTLEIQRCSQSGPGTDLESWACRASKSPWYRGDWGSYTPPESRLSGFRE